MNEEIKEILDKFHKGHDELKYDEYIAIENHIANLQQKIEQYERTQTYGDYVSTVNKLIDLQQENEILKSQLKGTTHCFDEEEHKRLVKENDRLNNIIDELEKYIIQEWYCFDNESVEHHVAWHILMKLKE